MRWFLLMGWLTTILIACAATIDDPSPNAPPLTDEPVGGILFTSERDGNAEIYLIQPDGSALTRLTDHPEIDAEAVWAPSGRQIAFRSRRGGSSDLFLMGADGRNPTNLINDPAGSALDDFAPAWQPDGQALLFYTDRFPFGSCPISHHMARIEIEAGAESMKPFIQRTGSQESFDWSPDGSQVAFSSNDCNQPPTRLYLWEQETQQSTPLLEIEGAASSPAWSHDGRFIAFQASLDGNLDIFVVELENREVTRLTRDPADDSFPTWSPDDSQIAFTSNRDGNSEIYVMRRDGTEPRNLTNHPGRDFRPDWSPIP